MRKTNLKQRVLSMLLAFSCILTVVQIGLPATTASAASKVTNSNLLKHSTFEETGVDLPYTKYGVPSVDNWYRYNFSTKVNNNAHTGEWAAQENNTNDSLEQSVPNLKVGATYEMSVWAKVTDLNASAYFGIKNYGGDELKQKITSLEYKQYTIDFTYSGSNVPLVYVWSESLADGAKVYVDDFSMVLKGDLQEISIENGKITSTYSSGYTGTPSKSDYTITYTSSVDKTDQPITITNTAVKDGVLTMRFDPIAAKPVKQLISVDVKYGSNTWTLDFPIESDGSPLAQATLSSVSAVNGTVTAVLSQDPTIPPEAKDFILEKSIDGGAYKPAAINSFSYNKATKTATLGYSLVNGANDKQRSVTIRLTYCVSETIDYTVEKNEQISYYVDAVNGKDTNDGKSPETAIQTINKVNTVTFKPGDKLLFKCGQVWTGALKPKGSGAEGAPIIIKSYGDGAKPVLKPGDDWTIPYFNIASDVIKNPKVNNVITFSNQQYWEVRDLELYDPKFKDIVPSTDEVYRRGINVSAEDVGDLYYFAFDDLTIHGFRGPNTNVGKSSGGIIMTVCSDPVNVSKRVPTAVNDITVTNCDMYDLGRSGFNFTSPWTTRTGDEWGSFSYTGYGDWKPYQNITIKNNTIHDIDGDGILIDGCKNVMVEHNTVYRAATNCSYGVCMFNWNSDNTVFQFNETYEAGPAGSNAWDAQGIEIDALNKDTFVQYNYIHDNTGGSFMWCATPTLRTIRGTYRYNIMQNDMTKSGIIDWRPNHVESMAYNNTIYLGEGQERIFMAVQDYAPANAKFYNNIFYNKGTIKSEGLDFHESEIDWKNNIFYGFDKVPSNDTAVITKDPMFVNPGTGTKGLDSVVGYKLKAGSPAIDAGVTITKNGGRDYFGTLLADGKTDIGAAEYTVPAPAYVTKSTSANKVSGISLDGLLKEKTWKTRQAITKRIDGDTNTIAANFGTAWDDTNMYVGVQVNDPTGKKTDFTKDSISLYLSPKNYRGTPYSADDFQLQISEDGATVEKGAAGMGKNDTVDCTKIQVSSKDTSDGYTMEIAIPWSEMGITAQEKYKLGIDIMAFDGDTSGCVLGWSGGNWNDTTKNGDVTLINDVSINVPEVAASKQTFNTKEAIQLNFWGAKDEDWVGIFKKGEQTDPTKALAKKDTSTIGQPDNSISFESTDFSAELPEGSYTAVMFKSDNSVISSSDFEIKYMVVTTNKTEYEQGEDITINYRDANLSVNDWVGIYEAGHAPGADSYYSSVAFQYTTAESGSMIFSAADYAVSTHRDYKDKNIDHLLPGKYTVYLLRNDGYTTAGEYSFTVKGDTETADPSASASVSYARSSSRVGYADGTVTIESSANSNITNYALYWGDENGKLTGYAPITVVAKNGDSTNYNMVKNTYIPAEASVLLVFAGTDVNATKALASCDIPQSAKFAAEKPTVKFQAISDIHVTDWEPSFRNTNFGLALDDIKSTAPDSNGVFAIGDNVDKSTDSTYAKFLEIFNAHKSGLPEFNFTIGNHEYFETVKDQFLPANNALTCQQKAQKFLTKMSIVGNAPSLYYDKYISGQHFIVLGSDQTELKDAFASISDTQFEWLKKKLAETKDKNQPIFLFLHQSMKDTVSGTTNGQNWWGMYPEQEAKLRAILKDYPQTIMFDGHTHWTLDDPYAMYDGKDKELSIFNTAGVGQLWSDAGETIEGSQGYFVEVYKDKVLVRGRDFKTGQWLPNASFVVDLKEKLPNLDKVDKTVLQKSLKEAAALKQSGYTAVSWSKLQAAVDAGSKLLQSATQSEVDSAAKACNDAMKALVKVSNNESHVSYSTNTTTTNPNNSVNIDTNSKTATVTTKPDTTPVSLNGTTTVTATVDSNMNTDAANTVNIVLPNNEIKTAVKTENVVMQLKVPAAIAENSDSSKKIVINAAADVLQAAAQSGKKVSITVMNADTGKLAYTCTIDGSALNKAAITKDINIAMSVKPLTSDANVNKAAQNKPGLVLSFNHSGSLPGPTTFNVPAGNYAAGTTLYLYYYNKLGMFEPINQTCKVDANGDVSVTITHCSQYVLLSQRTENTLTLDTVNTYIFGARDQYTFLAKSTSKTVPAAATADSSIASVKYLKKAANGYLFQITGIKDGATSVSATQDGKIGAFQINVKSGTVKSDTTSTFQIKKGKSYVVKFTTQNGTKKIPTFFVGTTNAFSTTILKKSGNDYYFKITATGKTGTGTGIYSQLPGQTAVHQCVVNIG